MRAVSSTEARPAWRLRVLVVIAALLLMVLGADCHQSSEWITVLRFKAMDPKERVEYIRGLAVGDPVAGPVLEAGLEDAEASVVATALNRLGREGQRLPHEHSLRDVKAHLTHRDERVRTSALAALGSLGRLTEVEAAAGLKDSSHIVRMQAVHTIGEARLESLADEVQDLVITDSHHVVRFTALLALGDLGWKQLKPLAEKLSAADPMMQYAIVSKICTFASTEPEAKAMLYRLARHRDANVREAAISAGLTKLGRRDVARLTAIAAKDPSKRIRALPEETRELMLPFQHQ